MAMHTWFECKIRYEKTMENGMNKKVTEPYLVDALSFTEAEARIIEEMTPFISGEFTVSDIKRANYSELFPCEEEAADRLFKCKLVFITLCLIRSKSEIPSPRPNPMIGPISGEINIAPIITAVEFVFKPSEATKVAKIRTQRFVPLNSMPFRIDSIVSSSSSFS